jgi:hypothetical protein
MFLYPTVPQNDHGERAVVPTVPVDEYDSVMVTIPAIGPQPISCRQVHRLPNGRLRAETETIHTIRYQVWIFFLGEETKPAAHFTALTTVNFEFYLGSAEVTLKSAYAGSRKEWKHIPPHPTHPSASLCMPSPFHRLLFILLLSFCPTLRILCCRGGGGCMSVEWGSTRSTLTHIIHVHSFPDSSVIRLISDK